MVNARSIPSSTSASGGSRNTCPDTSPTPESTATDPPGATAEEARATAPQAADTIANTVTTNTARAPN
ncbi:hypothetical protein GCM10009839_74210 [Catenulispora yoronensis]|uniref:Uncharacterized protein n=1 Tax=Catenulispora yoronensis TaxID=450799 RepID=A0ABN2V913_9ACTN